MKNNGQIFRFIGSGIILTLLIGLLTGCGGSKLTGTFYPSDGGGDFTCIEFINNKDVLLSDATFGSYAGTYQIKGRIIYITYNAFGNNAVDTYTINATFDTLNGENHTYTKYGNNNNNKNNITTLSGEYCQVEDNVVWDDTGFEFYSDKTFVYYMSGQSNGANGTYTISGNVITLYYKDQNKLFGEYTISADGNSIRSKIGQVYVKQ